MAFRLSIIIEALLLGSLLVGCTGSFVASDFGVRDEANATDIAVIVGALNADPRVDSARYITPQEMAATRELDTVERRGDVIIENEVSNGYISVELKSGSRMSDLDEVWESIHDLPEYDRVIEW